MSRAFKIISLAVLWALAPAIVYAGPVSLGYLLDLSGKSAFLGRQSRAGAELAARELEAQGNKIRLLFEDHQTEAKLAVSAARKLIDLNKVEAVLCDVTPSCTAASPIVAAAKKLFLYQAPIVSLLGKNPYAFKNFLDYEAGCRAVARHWKSLGISKVSHLKINFEFGELCLKGSSEVYPNQLVFDYNTTEDIRSVITKIKAFGAQAIFQTGYEADYMNRFSIQSELAFPAPAGMPEPLLTTAVLERIKKRVPDGTTTFGFAELDSQFVENLKKAGLYQGEVSLPSAAIAYLHVKLAAAAVSACRTADIDCQVRQVQSAAPDPVLGFMGWKDRIAQYDYRLKEWKDGALRTYGGTKSN